MSKLQEYLDVHLADFEEEEDFDDFLKSFGLKIKQIRLKKRLTQIELCNKVGLTQACLSSIENGKYNPSIKQVLKISNGLNCKVIFKMEDKDER